MKETGILFLKGCAIGVANIIPGVSGGTIAVVMGIYDRLIEAIACFFDSPEKRKGYILFLFKVIAGAVMAILLLANLMDYLLKEHFHVTMFAFFGLIIGGIPPLLRAHKDMRPGMMRIAVFLLGVLVVLGPAFLSSAVQGEGAAEVSSGSVTGMWGYLVILGSGFLAGGAMIVPGISGSFVLVLLGQYAVVIAAIKAMDVPPLLMVAAGAGIGILVFSKAIKICLEKAPSETYYFILGLLAASLWEIFPGVPAAGPAQALAAVVCLCALAVSWGMSRLSSTAG